MLDCILVKRYFHITKSSIFEWSIFMQQKYFSSLVLNTDRNCTRCQQQLKIREVYLSHYLLFTLKDEVPTWPLCSTCQQPQGSRRSGFRHYPFMRRKNERNISREFVRYIGVKHHLLWLSGKRKSTIIGLYLLPWSFTLEGTIGWAGHNFWGPA